MPPIVSFSSLLMYNTEIIAIKRDTHGIVASVINLLKDSFGICLFTIKALLMRTIIVRRNNITYAVVGANEFLKAKYENTTVSKYIVPDIKLSRFILPVACIKAVNNVFITFTEFAKSIHLQKETANGGTSINHNDIILSIRKYNGKHTISTKNIQTTMDNPNIF